MLLAHTSGMNSGADYRQLLDDNVERFALTRELVAVPGERVIYSDLGFIALGAAIERVDGALAPRGDRIARPPHLGCRSLGLSAAGARSKQNPGDRG